MIFARYQNEDPPGYIKDRMFLLQSQCGNENQTLKIEDKDNQTYSKKYAHLNEDFNQLKEEKYSKDMEYKVKHDSQARQLEELRTELKKARNIKDGKSIQCIMIQSEIKAIQNMIGNKDVEIEDLKSQLENSNMQNLQISNEIEELKGKLTVSREEEVNIKASGYKAKLFNDTLNQDNNKEKEKICDLEFDISVLERRINLTDNENKLLESEKKNIENETIAHKNAFEAIDQEIYKEQLSNDQLNSEINALRVKAQELELKKQSQVNLENENNILIQAKVREIEDVNRDLKISETHFQELLSEATMISKANEEYELLSNQYKEESESAHKAFEFERTKVNQLEEEQKKLESSLNLKEEESIQAKKGLIKADYDNYLLKNDNVSLNNELSSLKDHISILENQNISLHKEIDQIVSTDEVVSQELDRKAKFEEIKAKNLEELQKSL